MNRFLIFFMAIFGFNNAYFVMNQDQLTNFLNQAKESPRSDEVSFSNPKIVSCQIKLENGYCKIGHKENDQWILLDFFAQGEMVKLLLPELQKRSGKSSYFISNELLGAACVINGQEFKFVEVQKNRPCLMEIQLGGSSGPFFQSLICEGYALSELTFDRFFKRIFTGMSTCISQYIADKSPSKIPLIEMLKDFNYRKKFFSCDCNQTAASLDLINFIVLNLPFELSQEELLEKLSQAGPYSLEKRMLEFAFDLRAQGGALASLKKHDLQRVKEELTIATKKMTKGRIFSPEHVYSDSRQKSKLKGSKTSGPMARLAKRVVVKLPEPEEALIEGDSFESAPVARSSARMEAPTFRKEIFSDLPSSIGRSSSIESLNISQELPGHSSGARSTSVGSESISDSYDSTSRPASPKKSFRRRPRSRSAQQERLQDGQSVSPSHDGPDESDPTPVQGAPARSLRRRPPAGDFSPDQIRVSLAAPIRSLKELPEPAQMPIESPSKRRRPRRGEIRGGGTMPLGEESRDYSPVRGADLSGPGQRNSLPAISDLPVVGVGGSRRSKGKLSESAKPIQGPVALLRARRKHSAGTPRGPIESLRAKDPEALWLD